MAELNNNVSTNFIEDIIDEELASGKTSYVATRFPPEPNGYLHIGHAKSLCINFGIKDKYHGTCNLRYDDTNPTKEDVEFVDSIKEDIRWLGFSGDRELYASDYFDQLFDFAVDLIKRGLAYVCDMSAEEIIRYLKSQGFDGLLIFGMCKDDLYLQQLVESREFCTVVVDAPITNDRTSCVSVDNFKAQYDIAKKTITENTCRRVLYIAGRRNRYVTDERIAAMQKLRDDMGLTLMIRNGESSEKKAREIAFRYAANKDIVVCGSDLMAIGAMNALTEMDIFRPVCGFDGVTLMGYVGKQMNTVRQDFANIGANAVAELKRLFDGESGRRVILPYELVRMQYLDIIR